MLTDIQAEFRTSIPYFDIVNEVDGVPGAKFHRIDGQWQITEEALKEWLEGLPVVDPDDLF